MKYLFLILLLSGCGSENESAEYEGWTGEWVEKNDNFTVNYDSSIDGPLLETIEQAWLEVQACVGLPTPAGLVIEFADEMPAEYPYGYINVTDKYIRLRIRDTQDSYALSHEFVHWILYYHVGAIDPEHDSPFFIECVY